MRFRAGAAALLAASAALRAESPDWFDAFRGKAFLQSDESFVAREASAPRDAPPSFRARWVVLRYAGFTEKERRFWPSRNLLLVTLLSGAQYVLESSLGFIDENHLEEEHPWQRVASSRTAFEIWSSAGEPRPDETPDSPPCEGMHTRIRAPGGTFEYLVEDLGSRTVKALLDEAAAGTFDENERRDLTALLQISIDNDRSIGDLPAFQLRDALLAVNVAFRDQLPLREKRTIVLAPDPAPSTDFSPWRALARLPMDLPPFPALPPDTLTK